MLVGVHSWRHVAAERRHDLNQPNEGDVALFLVTSIAAQLKEKGLLDVDLLQQNARSLLARPLSDEQKATIELAIATIDSLKRKPHR